VKHARVRTGERYTPADGSFTVAESTLTKVDGKIYVYRTSQTGESTFVPIERDPFWSHVQSGRPLPRIVTVYYKQV
jgi:hypothetical protein